MTGVQGLRVVLSCAIVGTSVAGLIGGDDQARGVGSILGAIVGVFWVCADEPAQTPSQSAEASVAAPVAVAAQDE